VAWRAGVFSSDHWIVHGHSVSVKFSLADEPAWWFTGVYGPQDEGEKIEFLNELREVRGQCDGSWMLAGDFNMIYSAEDKNNDNLNKRSMGRFRWLVNDLELKEIPLLDRRYTWSNEREAPTLIKLDRVLCTAGWEAVYLEAILQSQATEILDHCPLLLGLKQGVRGKKKFHFESFWTKLEGFQEVVVESWNAPVVPVPGPLEQFSIKLKRLTRALQSWSQKKVGHVKLQLAIAREILHRLEIAQDSRPLSSDESWMRREAKCSCLVLASLERTIARLRSRIRFLKDDDANTALFHRTAGFRKQKNFIPKLIQEDRVITDQDEKQDIIFNFFNGILGTAARPSTLDLNFFHRNGIDLTTLEQPILEDEVWATINSLPADRAPGPDGYMGRFYKSCWPVIKSDFMAAVLSLQQGDSRKLWLLNSAYLTLIPTKEEAVTPKDFRPISLIHSFAKLITKIMANRLTPFLDVLVATSQSAFVKGRCIHDNFIMVQHTIKLLHKRKVSSLFLKLDIFKAFDSVVWPSLMEVLDHLGFSSRWKNLISCLLCTASTKVLVNGQPGEEIMHQRGLRQGNPLSPMLFILIMDVLNSLFLKAGEMELLQPLANRRQDQRISLYADDVALFIRPVEQEMNITMDILNKFGEASGLNTNL
jgi:hypothetical protein